jgi:Fe-S cluster assembly iron-binding protein IscA
MPGKILPFSMWREQVKQNYSQTRYGDGFYETIHNDDSRTVQYNDGSIKKTESPHSLEILESMYIDYVENISGR